MRRRHTLRLLLLVAMLCSFSASTAAAKGGKTPPHVSHPSRPAPPKVVYPAIPPGWPKYVIVPKLNIRAPIESISLASTQDSEAPFRWTDVAWYDRGPKPGVVGRATIFGHLDSYCCPAVFYLLRDLVRGDIIQVQYKSGAPLSFRVTWSKSFPNTALPLHYLYGPTRERGLALLTCAGVFHLDGTGYDHKLIVYGTLIPLARKPATKPNTGQTKKGKPKGGKQP